MRLTTLVLMCVTLVLWEGLVQAETYLGGLLGVAVPLPGMVTGDENLNYPNPPGPGQLFRGASTQIGMKESLAYGVKAGHYFDRLAWLGIEAELLTATPHVMAGTIAIDTKSQTVGTFREAQSGVHLRMTTGAVSVLVRYPGHSGNRMPASVRRFSGGMQVEPAYPAITGAKGRKWIPPV